MTTTRFSWTRLGRSWALTMAGAGLLLGNTLSQAAEPVNAGPATYRQSAPDQVFENAGEYLRNYHSQGTQSQPVGYRRGDDAINNAPVSQETTYEAPAAEAPAAPEGPWTVTELFTDDCGQNGFKDNNIKFSGNLVQSYTWNFSSPANRFNGPVTWTDRSNEYQLNQLWLQSEKTTDTSKNDWDWGWKTSLNYGTSSRLFTSSGLDDKINGANPFYGWAIPNMYLEVAYKKAKLRAGRFVSPIGYFTVNTVDNFFNTIPYTYQWGEPFTHTGLWGVYDFNEKFQVTSGLIRGWDNFDNSNPHLGYLGTWSYTTDSKTNIAQVVVYSLEQNFNLQFSPRYYQSLVLTKPINDNWTYVGQSDFGYQSNATFDGRAAKWYGVNQYVYRKINDHWTWGLNFEWWRDEQGYRVAQFLPNTTVPAVSGISSQARGAPLGGGFEGNFFRVTVGPKWYPTKSQNFFIRPNARVDWYSGHENAVINPNQLKPYKDGKLDYQGLFVTDVVLLF